MIIIGAVTENRVKVIISDQYPEKDIILTNFVINNIYEKVHEEESG